MPKVWAKVNGLFSPVVLYDGRLVASWKTITKGRRTDLEVSMLDPHPPLADDLFGDAVAATEQVLDLTITTSGCGGLRAEQELSVGWSLESNA